MEKLAIGYGVVDKSVETFAGGVMVTDPTGLPVEFRYTEPLTPTRIQKVLYGDVLESYIKGEVIIKSLFDHLDNPPDIIIVSEEAVIEMPAIGVPLVSISDTRLKPLNAAGDIQKIEEAEYLLQVNETGSPVRVKLLGGPGDAERVNAILVGAGKTMDLTEPLDRVHEALKILCSKEREK